MKQKNKPTPRGVAVNALLKMENNNGYSNIVIDQALLESGLNARDRSLATHIFYGTLEKKLLLAHYVKACLTNPEKPLEPEVEAVLYTAAYQILFLEKVPDFAAVDEAVSIIRQLGKPGAAGFVNGVLRSLLRKQGKIAEQVQEDWLLYSIPESLIHLWRAAYGRDETGRILEAFAQKPKQYIRVNPLKTDVEALQASLKDKLTETSLPYAMELQGSGQITELPDFQLGHFHVQDLSAQLVCTVLNAQPGEVIYDMCAAPGGKTFTIAEQMKNQGKVYAFDLYKSRMRLIRDGAERLGLTCVEMSVRDACEAPAALEVADRVLCDVPCSGYGVIRRKPEIRYKPLREAEGLPEIQYRILCNGARIVKPGGCLVYATCTLNPAENEEVAERFLQAHKTFTPCPITALDNFRRREEPAHMLTIMPYAASSDGFFMAVFQKLDVGRK